MPANAIPTVDLDTWRTDPAAVAAQVDTARRVFVGSAGFRARRSRGPGVWQDAPFVRARARRDLGGLISQSASGVRPCG